VVVGGDVHITHITVLLHHMANIPNRDLVGDVAHKEGLGHNIGGSTTSSPTPTRPGAGARARGGPGPGR
jgi:hypothetical protein